MYTMEDILAQMKNGEDIEDIAQSFAKALNAAKSKYDEEIAEAAKREAEAAIKTKKIEDFAEIIDALYDFIMEYYVKSDEDLKALDAALDDVDAEEVLDELESVFGGFIGLLNMTNIFSDKDGNVKLKINIPPTTFSGKKPAMDSKTVDSMIKNVMKSFGW